MKCKISNLWILYNPDYCKRYTLCSRMSNFIYIIIQKYLRTYVHTYACMHTNILTRQYTICLLTGQQIAYLLREVENIFIDRSADNILMYRAKAIFFFVHFIVRVNFSGTHTLVLRKWIRM